MKCINNELIQRYIDGETDLQETARIKKHLSDCPQCTRNVEEQKTFAEAIKKRINNSCQPPFAIPEFVAPNVCKHTSVRKHKLNLKIKYYIYAASAASAIFLIFFLRKEHNAEPPHVPPSIQLIYGFNGDFDSNRTVSQQEMTIIVIDADGKIIECNEL